MTFHAGQFDYYSKSATGITHLQAEVEAKVAKAFASHSGSNYEMLFQKNPIVQQYFKSIKNGEEIDFNLQYHFEEAVNTFAEVVYDIYKSSWKKAGKEFLEKNSPNNYDASMSLDYFRSLVNPNEAEPIIITPSDEN